MPDDCNDDYDDDDDDCRCFLLRLVDLLFGRIVATSGLPFWSPHSYRE